MAIVCKRRFVERDRKRYGVDVSMDDPSSVSFGERIRDLNAVAQHSTGIESFATDQGV